MSRVAMVMEFISRLILFETMLFVVEEFNRRAIMLWTMLLISFQTGEWI